MMPEEDHFLPPSTLAPSSGLLDDGCPPGMLSPPMVGSSVRPLLCAILTDSFFFFSQDVDDTALFYAEEGATGGAPKSLVAPAQPMPQPPAFSLQAQVSALRASLWVLPDLCIKSEVF